MKIEFNSPSADSKQSLLTRVENPTIIIFSGTVGAGKTSTIKNLLDHNSNDPHEVAVILNEVDEDAAKIDQRTVDFYNTKTLGGCSCCTSFSETTNTLIELAKSGKKLIIIEQSGSTDGARLLAGLQANTNLKNTQLKLVCIYNSLDLEPNDALVANNLSCADKVLLSHVNMESNYQQVTNVNNLIRLYRNRDADSCQKFPGEISDVVWKSLLNDSNTDLSKYFFNPDLEKKRQGVMSQRYFLSIDAFPNQYLSATEFKKLFFDLRVYIERAKGEIYVDGELQSVHFVRISREEAFISIEKSKTNVIDPFLIVISLGAPAPLDLFAKMGLMRCTNNKLQSILRLYPLKETISKNADSDIVRFNNDLSSHFNRAIETFILSRNRDIPEAKLQEINKYVLSIVQEHFKYLITLKDCLQMGESSEAKNQELITVSYNFCLSMLIARSLTLPELSPFYNALKARMPLTTFLNAILKQETFKTRDRKVENPNIFSNIAEFLKYRGYLDNTEVSTVLNAVNHLRRISGEIAEIAFKDNI